MPAIIGDVNSIQQTQRTIVNQRSQLGKDEFMKILLVQLSTQDPLSPMQDTEFIAQMAQFSALEQMTQMNSVTTMNSAYNMIGKIVSFTVDGKEAANFVDSVFKGSDGMPRLQAGDYVLTMNDVISVYDKSVLGDDMMQNILDAINELKDAVTGLKPQTDVDPEINDDNINDGVQPSEGGTP